MKGISILIVLLFLPNYYTFSQDKLVIEYEHTLQFDVEMLEKNLSFGDAKVPKQEVLNALKEAMGKSNYYELMLTPSESEFKYIEKISNEQPNDARIVVSFGGAATIYKDLKENIGLRSENVWNKDFLIKDSLKVYDWKISKDLKEILGYEVRKAETKSDSTQTIIAWYAPKLPYKNGPVFYQGLPGLILELEIIQNSEKEKRTEVYTATAIRVDSKNIVIKRPSKGKLVNEKEFEDFMKAQSDRMNNMYENGVDKE